MEYSRVILLGIVFTVSVLTVISLGGKGVGGETITVDDDGGADYERIQDAIDNATQGDIIRVFDGMYDDGARVNKTLTLVGNGSETTSIDTEGSMWVVLITADWVNLSGFEILQGDIGLRVVSDHNTIFDNYFANNDDGICLEGNDNIIENNTFFRNENGIYLRYSRNTIQNNTCIENEIGIYDYSGNNNIHRRSNIIHNTLTNNKYGVYSSRTRFNTVSNNTCLNNTYGFYLWDCREMIVKRNVCSDNSWYGIVLFDSNSNELSRNICDNNLIGIGLIDSRDNSIAGNEMIGCGVLIRGNSHTAWSSQSFDGKNSVNGKPLYFYKNTENLTIPLGAGQIILVDCRNVIIENQVLDNGTAGMIVAYSEVVLISNSWCSNNNEDGIIIRYSSYVSIMNNSGLENGGDGISLQKSDNCTITGNNCSGNTDSGIFLDSSSNNTIDSNMLLRNRNGIYASVSDHNRIINNTCSLYGNYGISIYDSNNCIIENNTCSLNNNYGIYLRDSSDCTITNNTCLNNDQGIYLWYSSKCTIKNNICSANNHIGILLHQSKDNILSNNTCSSNSEKGIELFSSSNCRITNNTLVSNYYYAIYLYDSWGCTITNNTCSSTIFHGIRLSSSSACTVTNNTCSNNNIGINIYRSDNSTILNNTCEYNWKGISLRESDTITIISNTIAENDIGISLKYFSKNATAYQNLIHDNTESGINATENNGFAINAIHNWWGNTSGPYHPTNNSEGEGDNVTDYVLFDPWVVREDPEVHRTWFVDDDSPDDGNGSRKYPFNKIQDGIDASETGDTIRVFDGTYIEDVKVDTSVNLIGNGSGSTIIPETWVGVEITADNVTISGFSILGDRDSLVMAGIYVRSDRNTISDIVCSNFANGIQVDDSSNTKIQNNSLIGNECGIRIFDSKKCMIINNSESENDYGMVFQNSYNLILKENVMGGEGIGIFGWSVDHWNSHIIDDSNHVNGLPIYYRCNLSDITVPQGYGQIILANCTNLMVENQYFDNRSSGLWIGHSSNMSILNNTILHTEWMGLYLSHSLGCRSTARL